MIHSEQANFSVSWMCVVLGVARSAYYAWLKRPVSKRAQEDARLLPRIEEHHKASRGTYGSTRITDDLKDEGETVGHNRVARIMKEHAIVGKPLKKFVVTTDSKHELEVAPNLLQREFEADAPNQVWVGDITYAWTWRGWAYLATVIDLFGRTVVGWELADHMSADLVVRAFEKACAVRDVKPGLIFHSDRGSQYASDAFKKVLEKHGAIASMSRKGDCWDNAVAESFFATIKRELLNRAIWMNLGCVRAAIHEYIEVFYNRKRRHSANGNISPAEYERLYNKAAEAA